MRKTAETTTPSAEAGRRGEEVRSDCWVRITPADSAGIRLDLKSKVESMYGEATRKLVHDVCAALRVTNAALEIEDQGALPFVIAARVETAVRRLGLNVSDGFLPDFAPGTECGTERDRFRRSRLYLPGNEPKFMLNAGLHGPDGAILDLEDSVAPAEKDAARVLVRNALRSLDFHGAERMVRINQNDVGLTDLEFVVPHNVQVILIPKVEDAEQVRRVDRRIGEILKQAGPTDARASARAEARGSGESGLDSAHGSARDSVYLMPIVESALGAIRAYEIASASPNVVALTIGIEDYTADIGAAPTREGRESFWARSQVVNAARAAGVQPIDSVFADVVDMDALRESVLEAKRLGFDGKGCIHPRQIAVIHDAFTPTKEELEKARTIVEAFEDAQRRGLSVVSLGNKMIDPPVVRRALRVVRLAKSKGLID